LATTYARELATLADFSSAEVNALILAVEEACSNSMEHAFDREDSGSLILKGELTPTALTLAICDSGLPFDQSLAPVYQPPQDADPTQVSLQGLGLSLISHAVDEVQWSGHGREGKELRLIKYRPLTDLAETGVAAAPTPKAEITPSGSNITIRRMHPDEALRVAQCFYRTFGYTYEEDLYIPERLIYLNRTGEFISVVAVEEDSGEVVGHVAMVRENLGPVGEFTHLVVAPPYRGHDLRRRMGDFLEQEVRRLGIVGLYGQAVTSHTISQKASESRGFHVCGISLAEDKPYNFKRISSLPGKGDATETGDLPSQRESLVFYFKYLVTPPPALVYAPSHHQDILRKIYDNLEAPRDFSAPENISGLGELSVNYYREDGLGEIKVKRVGVDTIVEVRRAWRDLVDIAGAEVVYLYLPLDQKGTINICLAAEEDGFFFSGIWPHYDSDSDFLRLQYLKVDLDVQVIQIYSPFGQELLSYALQEKERVKKLGKR
jgi:anti-sigma regulatory factor (Ser/Thr protein kinase)/GNAT superfamily N-acetyltransferase